MCNKVEVKNGQFPGIYKITENLTGRVYIGQTSRSINERLTQHVYTPAPNSDIDNAIQAKGMDAFTFEVEVPMKNPTTEQLWFQEYWYIAKYDSFSNGFNKTRGNRKGEFEACLKSDFICVGEDLFKDIIREYSLGFRGKRILLINNFDESIKNYLRFESGRENVDIIYESFDIDEKDALGEFILAKARGMKKTKVDLINGITKVEKEHYDIIISNPPYGKIGNEITQCIVDNVDFDVFVNLLPCNDYLRWNRENKLYQYVDIRSMKTVTNGFSDANVTTMMCKINKERAYYISEDEFTIENYSDESLKKFFYGNAQRSHYALDNYDSGHGQAITKWNPERTVIIGLRDIGNKHMPYDRNCTSYKWNVEKSVDWKYVVENHSNPRAEKKGTYEVYYSGINFNTAKEKDNFVDFLYSSDGFRFMSKVFTAAGRDGGTRLYQFFPEIDWTKKWTVESILEDYGYTEDEIDEVMADLVNFKDMER